MQPTLPLLYRMLAAADLEPRVSLEPYDDHDDDLDLTFKPAGTDGYPILSGPRKR